MTRPDLIVEFRPGARPLDNPQGYLDVPGTVTDYASTPDHASLDITTDIDIRADLTLDDWTPATARVITSKWEVGTSGVPLIDNQRSWLFGLTTGGELMFLWSATDGSTVFARTSSEAVVPDANSGRLAVRATLDVDDTATSSVVSFYTTRTIDDPWIQLGVPQSESGTSSVFASTASLEIGREVGGIDGLDGNVHAVQVRDGLDGTLVADADFRRLVTGTTEFIGGAGLDWTVNGDASVVGPDGVSWVELTAGGPHGNRVASANWSDGRERDDEDTPPGEGEIRLYNHDRLFDPDNSTGTYAGQLEPRVPFRIRCERLWLQLPDGANRDASTPDDASLDITGDLDVAAVIAPDAVVPSDSETIIGKFRTAGDQRSWNLGLVSITGALSLTWSETGSGTTTLLSSDFLVGKLDADGLVGVRATLDVDNGEGGHTARFYTGPTIDGPWTQLGVSVTASGTTEIFSSTSPLSIGINDTGATADANFDGWVYEALVRDGIGNGAIVANPQFWRYAPGTTSFTDSAGREWTLTGTAAIQYDDTHPEDLFYGYVEDGWEQHYDPPAESICTVRLVDVLGVLAGFTLPGTFDAAVLDFDPVGYWRMHTREASEEIADLAGNNDGAVVGDIDFSNDPIVRGLPGHGVFNTDNANTDRIDISRSPIIDDNFHATIVAVFKTNVLAEAASIHPLFAQTNGNGAGSDDAFRLYISTTSSQIDYVIEGSGFSYVGPDVSDGDSHIMFGQSNTDSALDFGIAVDTATISGTSAVSFFQGGNGAAIGGTPNAAAGFTDNYFEGSIAAVAVYDTPLTEGARQAIIDGLNALDGQRSDQHIRWALNEIGIPDTMLLLDEGRAIMGPAETDGMDALEFIRRVTATEQGAFYVDHRAGGRLRFRERYTPWLASRAVKAQVAFSDDPDADDDDVVRAEAASLDIEPNGISTIANQWTVRWLDGEETVADTDSIRDYGARGDTVETLANNPNTARGIGQFRLAQTASPRTQIRGLGLDPSAHESAFPAAVALRLLDRITLRRQPQATGAVDTKQLHIQGTSHSVDGLVWTVRYFTSSAPDATVSLFTLGTSQLDGTDVLGI